VIHASLSHPFELNSPYPAFGMSLTSTYKPLPSVNAPEVRLLDFMLDECWGHGMKFEDEDDDDEDDADAEENGNDEEDENEC
jgi:hypothetical protein